MKRALILTGFAVLLILPVDGLLNSIQAMDVVDGLLTVCENDGRTSTVIPMFDGTTIDLVGGTDYSATGSGRAKGNSYQIDLHVTLDEMEFWLNFSNSQTLTYYVFVCPDEFGTYNEVYRDSETVSGTGAGWYSSGPVSVDMTVGNHYIIAVSWSGSMSYFFNASESQSTSFGSQTHGYPSGSHPLPASFQSLNNDQAIYYQRLTTTDFTALDASTWGSLKAALGN